MADSREKLSALRGALEPELRSRLEALGVAGGMAAAFLAPQVEAWCDRQLAREPADLDRAIAAGIAFLGGLRSDDAPSLIVSAGDASYAERCTDGCAGGVHPIDPLRASGVRDGSHQDGEIDAGPRDLPVSG